VLEAGALGGVDEVGVAPAHRDHLRHHPPERPVPLHGVVAAGLPRVDEDRLAEAARVALGQEEAMPGVEDPQQRAGAALVRMVVEEQPHRGGRQRRLGDPGDAAAVGAHAPAPPARAGQVAAGQAQRGAAAEGDVRDHPLPVASSRERLELGPRARGIELGPAERRQRGVPVPLVRVRGPRRQRVAPAVVPPQHVRGGAPHAAHVSVR
jgi:hypothetical protein